MLAYPVVWSLLRYATDSFTLAAPSISLWFPAVGFTYAFVLVFGLRFVPVVALGAVCSYVFFNGDNLPASAFVLYGLSDVLIVGGMATLMLRWVRIDPRLPRLRDVLWFVTLVAR